MCVFEKAKLPEVREAFIASREHRRQYSEALLVSMKEYILSDACVRDLDRLEHGDYFLDPPLYRLVPKNFQGKKRAVYSFQDTQSYLIKLVSFAMRGIERFYSDRLFSFRPDKTAEDLLFEVCNHRGLQDLFILKTDVSNYVGSIVPELLIPKLEKLFLPEDPAFYHFLVWLLTRNRVVDHEGHLIDHCPGGMGGIPLGNFFMNVYLDEMDAWFSPRAAFYSRYSDDILIAARTLEEIREYEQKYYEFLHRLQLSTNREKTRVLQPGEPFDFLGMELCEGRITISAHSMKKIRRKLRIFADRALILRNTGKMTPDEAAQDLIIRFNRYSFGVDGEGNIFSWARWAFPVITDTESLEQIDHYFQDSLRYVLYGSMKRRNRSIAYVQLSALGYKTLVYYYHHQDRIPDIPRAYPKKNSAPSEAL